MQCISITLQLQLECERKRGLMEVNYGWWEVMWSEGSWSLRPVFPFFHPIHCSIFFHLREDTKKAVNNPIFWLSGESKQTDSGPTTTTLNKQKALTRLSVLQYFVDIDRRINSRCLFRRTHTPTFYSGIPRAAISTKHPAEIPPLSEYS